MARFGCPTGPVNAPGGVITPFTFPNGQRNIAWIACPFIEPVIIMTQKGAMDMTILERKQMVASLAEAKASDSEQLVAWLKAEGLVRDPTPEERGLAAEWDAVPKEEKQNHIRLMHSLALEPLLSQIIIESHR